MNSYFEVAKNFNPFQQVLGLVRSILALSLFLTLLANDPIDLFFPVKNLTLNDTFTAKINFFYLAGLHQVELMRAIALCILALVIFGWRPRITCLLHAWVTISFAHGSEIIEGGDQINSILTMIITPLLLIDPRSNHWNISNSHEAYYKNIFGYLTFCLFRFQMAFIYFEAGVEKNRVAEWSDGTALYYFMTDYIFGAPNFLMPFLTIIFDNIWLLTLATWSVMFLEIVLAGALFMDKKWWPYLLVVAISFHFSIIFIHGLGSFFLSMSAGIIGYLTTWNHPLSLAPLKKFLTKRMFVDKGVPENV